jgi:hypothetical protein
MPQVEVLYSGEKAAGMFFQDPSFEHEGHR